jgi:putative hydrolase of the HAD superfamily
MIDWLLVDYGETISTPFRSAAVNELAKLAGQKASYFLRRYWDSRPEYDLGQPTEIYWSRVLRRDQSDLCSLVVTLNQIDVQGWMGLNRLALRTMLTYARQTGTRMALLSNAPEPLAAAIDRSDWSHHFSHRFYSCRLGHAKPDPAAFTTALDRLGADPHRVLFIDDRAENTLAAEALNIPTITFTTARALTRELPAPRSLPASARARCGWGSGGRMRGMVARNEILGPDTVGGVAGLRAQGFEPIEEYTGAVWVAQLWPEEHRRLVAETRRVWLNDVDSDGRLWLVRSPWPSLGLGESLNVVWSWVERDHPQLDEAMWRRRVSETLAWDETTAVEWHRRTAN